MPLPYSNTFQGEQQKIQREASSPSDQSLNMALGRITEIDEDTQQVKVRLFSGRMVGEDPKRGNFLPLVNEIDDILFRFGPLRKNLVVRVMWRGKTSTRNALVEVIAGEDAEFLKQKPVDQGGVGVHKLMSPGGF